MGCITSTSYCGKPFLEDYLHIKIESVEGIRVRADPMRIHSRGELYLKITYKGKSQCTDIHNVCDKDFLLNENLILNGPTPCKSGNHCLSIQLLDYDTVTGNDFLGSCNISVPTVLNEEKERKRLRLKDCEGRTVAFVNISQLHFTKEKLNQYTGGCKLFCCLFCCQNVGKFD